MVINWKQLKEKIEGLYCYSITIHNGAIVRTRAYYDMGKNSKSYTGNGILDKLIDAGLIACFSRGYDEHNDFVKYDLHVIGERIESLYFHLSQIAFFSCQAVKDLIKLAQQGNLLLKNNIIGAKVSKLDYELKNLCLYFRSKDNTTADECQDLIYKICKHFNLDSSIVIPLGRKLFLRLIALDFDKDALKLKFYFHFHQEYNVPYIIRAFDNTLNADLVQDITHSNGSIWGFQIATTDNDVTYNFYLKE